MEYFLLWLLLQLLLSPAQRPANRNSLYRNPGGLAAHRFAVVQPADQHDQTKSCARALCSHPIGAPASGYRNEPAARRIPQTVWMQAQPARTRTARPGCAGGAGFQSDLSLAVPVK